MEMQKNHEKTYFQLQNLAPISNDSPWNFSGKSANILKSTLVQVMVWCRQATSHNLSQCWATLLRQYGVARLQCVNSLEPRDAIWGQWSWSTFAQVMACFRVAPSHNISQCWNENCGIDSRPVSQKKSSHVQLDAVIIYCHAAAVMDLTLPEIMAFDCTWEQVYFKSAWKAYHDIQPSSLIMKNLPESYIHVHVLILLKQNLVLK